VSYGFTRAGPPANKNLEFPVTGIDKSKGLLNVTEVAAFKDAIQGIMLPPCNRSLTAEYSNAVANKFKILTSNSDAVYAIQFPVALVPGSTTIQGFNEG